MEEIPGPKTFEITRKKVVDTLSAGIPGFKDVFPCPRSWRAKPGQAMAEYIDHTLLKPAASAENFERLCREALDWKVWSVCVPSNRVALASRLLAGSSVKVCTVVGFPLGYASTAAKVEETRAAIREGATEIDMVVPLGLVKDGDWLGVYRDIRSVVVAADSLLVKVILETSELGLEEKLLASWVACFAGAGFLKTSTGFASGGAQIDDLHILRTIAGSLVGVKASGGIRTPEYARSCIEAGADRLGTSSSGAILGLAAAGTGY